MRKPIVRVIDAIKKNTEQAIAPAPRFFATMGDVNGTVLTGVTGVIYVTYDNGQTVEALNRTVPNRAGIRVIVGYTDNMPGVLQVLSEVGVYGKADGAPLVPDHAPTHEYAGGDTDFVSMMRIKWMLTLPSSGFEIQLYGGVFQKADGSATVVENQLIDLSGDQPATGALYVLIEFDDDGNIVTTAGSTVATKELLTLSDIPDVDLRPIWAIQLYAGQAEIQRNPNGINDFVDLRFGLGVAQNALAVDGVPVDMTTSPPTHNQIMIYDACTDTFYPGSAGSGDMIKAVYDTDDDGVVDGAEDTQAIDGILVDNTSTPPTDGQVMVYDAYLEVYVPDDAAGSGAVPHSPGGRLTLASGTPVMATEQAAKTSIYYTPYKGDLVPIYDGSWTEETFTELTLALDSDGGHTGYHQSGKLFDLFVYDDSGTLRLVSGPAWTNDTTPATAVEFVNGILMNAASMTGRFGTAAGNTVTVAQDRGTWVGTFYASANGTTTWELGGAAAGGDPIKLYLWNLYNRVFVSEICRDNANSWTYSTATYRSKNNSTGNRVSFVRGLAEDGVTAENMMLFGQTVGVAARWGIALDATNTFHANTQINTTAAVSATALYRANPSAGFHFLQAVEWHTGTGTGTWFGDNSGNNLHGLTFSGMF